MSMPFIWYWMVGGTSLASLLSNAYVVGLTSTCIYSQITILKKHLIAKHTLGTHSSAKDFIAPIRIQVCNFPALYSQIHYACSIPWPAHNRRMCNWGRGRTIFPEMWWTFGRIAVVQAFLVTKFVRFFFERMGYNRGTNLRWRDATM